MTHRKLFLPGPTEVDDRTLAAMATPMIGHRSSEFRELYRSTSEKLQELLETSSSVFVLTGSATMAMEMAVRNACQVRCLNLVCGAFSQRWHEITRACGIEADRLDVDWGRAHTPEEVRRALGESTYDCVTVVYSETSTGILNPLEAIAETVREFPDTFLLVDAVSAMGGTKISGDFLGVDVLFAGVQKAFGVPPGIVPCLVTPRLLERSSAIADKGYFLDFEVHAKAHSKWQTLSTPAISQLYALNVRLDQIFEEGLEAVYQRHQDMANITRTWARERFELFTDPDYLSPTLTVIRNTRGISVAGLNEYLAGKGVVLANGYGSLKEKTFRISHMGSVQPEEVEELLGWIDEFLEKN
ncbi:MAG: alanine--glyoxylate aminotransferase family protein [Planctomycetota bacterium]|nr:alanine--glyoxylate aminotransferase family protein [Planctomycetota bacterium]